MNPSFLALRRGGLLALNLFVAFTLVACSTGDGDASEPAGGRATVSGGAVEITAADLAFPVTTIQATAGAAFTITLVNNDSVPHNISIYAEEGGELLAEGTVINGGETVELRVDPLDAGEYYFMCDLHPADMNGTLVVEG